MTITHQILHWKLQQKNTWEQKIRCKLPWLQNHSFQILRESHETANFGYWQNLNLLIQLFGKIIMLMHSAWHHNFLAKLPWLKINKTTGSVCGWIILVLNESITHLHRKHQKFLARWPWLGKPLWTRRKPVAQSNRTGTAGSSRNTAPQPGNSTGTSPVVSKVTPI